MLGEGFFDAQRLAASALEGVYAELRASGTGRARFSLDTGKRPDTPDYHALADLDVRHTELTIVEIHVPQASLVTDVA